MDCEWLLTIGSMEDFGNGRVGEDLIQEMHRASHLPYSVEMALNCVKVVLKQRQNSVETALKQRSNDVQTAFKQRSNSV